MTKYKFFVIIFSFTVLFNGVFVSPASAHHVWINATRYNLESIEENPKAKTVLYFGWGDYYPLHDFLREGQLERLNVRGPDGKSEELKTPSMGFNETPLELSQNGVYLISASLKPSFVSDVWQDGKMEVLRKPKNELPKDVKILESKYGLQFAKSIINVGDVSEKDLSFSKPVGHDFEIIPLVNPRTLREGDYLPFQILFKGEPLKAPHADPKICATYVGFSTGKGVFASTAELNKNGIVKLKIIRAGVWQIFVEYSLPPTPEMAEQADKIEYKASLTFEVY
jgi:uncharacterized GH25 family protein